MARQPGTISVINGPEYISFKPLIWRGKCGIAIQRILPGQPQQTPTSSVATAFAIGLEPMAPRWLAPA